MPVHPTAELIVACIGSALVGLLLGYSMKKPEIKIVSCPVCPLVEDIEDCA